MDTVWSVVVIVLGLLAWGGQVISWLWPDRAARLGLSETEADVEPVFSADNRAEAAWDSLVLWTLPGAGLMLVLGFPAWAYLGLIGGGIYLYFGGRGIFARIAMQRRGMRIGAEQTVRVNLTFLALWGVVGLITIVAAIADLPTS